MRKINFFKFIFPLFLAPWACQKTYNVGPLTSNPPVAAPTATATPNPELNRWNVAPEPFIVTVDSAGNFYPLDSLNNSNMAQKYSASGSMAAEWANYGSGNGQLSTPWGIAFDIVGGVLYVADTGNNRVEEFDTSGNYLNQFPTAAPGYAIAVDAAGNLYLSEATGIEEYTGGGTFVTSWGSFGTGNGQVGGTPPGIAVDASGNVFVVDNANYRVEKFSNSGTYLGQWGSNGTGNGQFSVPYGIAVNGAGNVYVADEANDNVQKFNNNGAYLSQWGGSVAYLNGPTGVWMDGSGHLYIANSADDQIVEIQF